MIPTKTINVLEYALLLILAIPTLWWIGKQIGNFLGRLLGQIVVFFLGASIKVCHDDGTEEIVKLRFLKAVKWCNFVDTELRKAEAEGRVYKTEVNDV